MNGGDYTYIWEADDWPTWRFDLAVLAQPMANVSRAQGLLMGRLADCLQLQASTSGALMSAMGRRPMYGKASCSKRMRCARHGRG